MTADSAPTAPVANGTSSSGGNNSNSTEGWLELFVTPTEKSNFSQWTEVLSDTSIVHFLCRDWFLSLAQLLPNHISPNLIAITSLVMLVQAWYIVHIYQPLFPLMCTYLAILHVLAFFITNSITNYHADRIRQHTPLNDLFKYSCDSCATVFLALLLTYCLGNHEQDEPQKTTETQWYCVQACQLVLFLKHLSAFKRHAGLRYRFYLAGPGEVLMSMVVILMVRAYWGDDFHTVYKIPGQRIYSNLTQAFTESSLVDHTYVKPNVFYSMMQVFLLSGGEWIKILYYLLFVAAILNSSLLPARDHGWTRFGLLVSLSMRLVPALLLHIAGNHPHMLATTNTVTDVICDGLFMAVLTSDLILAKMAHRELHPWVVCMSLAAVLSYAVILTLVAVYFIGVFSDLCFYMNLPLLAISRNVYCDGVFDITHVGHKRLFQNALAHGNRLFVGVVGDEDAQNYKRPPIMTHEERCAEVQGCKAVTKVIQNAPCFGLTKEFLDQHQIHVVAFGEEYLERYPDPKDDPYYRVPREMGIAKPLPRTKGLSTSDLIRRIQNAASADDKKSPT